MEASKQSPTRKSLRTNIAISTFQASLSVLSCTALVVLFSTQGFQIKSLTHVGEGPIPPAAVISILTIVSVGSTSVLVIRAVEHGLWFMILRRDLHLETGLHNLDDEVRRRAQWSVSHLARFTYTFRGKSWPMKMSGVLLLGTVVLNPVLIYSVSPKQSSSSTITEISASDQPFAGFISGSSVLYSADDAVTIGSLLHLKNIDVPSSSLCSQTACVIETRATALQAQCVTRSENWNAPYLTDDGESVGGPFVQPQHCSVFGKDTCVQMENKPINTHNNFTTGPSTECGTRLSDVMAGNIDVEEFQCPPGDFAIFFGVWYNWPGDSSPYTKSKPWHTLNCQIQHGTISVVQNGSGIPELERDSFVKSSAGLKIVGDPLSKDGLGSISADFNMSVPWFWQMGYLGDAPHGQIGRAGMPLTFAVGGKIAVSFSLAQALLGAPSFGNLQPYIPLGTNRDDAEAVARDVEASFDVATLLAFARASHAASLKITTTEYSNRWQYNVRVLPVLAIPLLATLLVYSVFWRVYGDDIVIGYNPLGIARRAGEITTASSERHKGSDSDGHTVSFKSDGGDYSSIKQCGRD